MTDSVFTKKVPNRFRRIDNERQKKEMLEKTHGIESGLKIIMRDL